MSKQNKIVPRKKNSSPDFSVSEIVEGMKDHPRFKDLTEKHWKAIHAMWDIIPGQGPRPAKEIAELAGVAQTTVNNWRTRPDFLEASELMGRFLAHEYRPALVKSSLEDAVKGDKKERRFWLERMFPKEPITENQGKDIILNISWGNVEVIDAEIEEQED